MLIGMIFGRLAGEIMALSKFGISPAVFALIGAGAYVAAVTGTFSSAIVIVELTGLVNLQFYCNPLSGSQFLIEILVGTSVALTVARYFGATKLFKQCRLLSPQYFRINYTNSWPSFST